MNTQKSLYDQDYFTWLNQNIDLLKNRNFSELDVPNLIEELSDKAKEEKNEIFFNAQAIISYFLKCSVSNDISQEEKSKVTITKQALSHRIYESPSLEEYMESILEEAYDQARISIQYFLGKTFSDFPKKCPYTVEQIVSKKRR